MILNSRRISTFLGVCAVASLLPLAPPCPAQTPSFAERRQTILERLEKSPGKTQNKDVHSPPMVAAEASDLDDQEPVIGVFLKGEARAYPLIMLFGGGGIFELLNDTCGGLPIATSW